MLITKSDYFPHSTLYAIGVKEKPPVSSQDVMRQIYMLLLPGHIKDFVLTILYVSLTESFVSYIFKTLLISQWDHLN